MTYLLNLVTFKGLSRAKNDLFQTRIFKRVWLTIQVLFRRKTCFALYDLKQAVINDCFFKKNAGIEKNRR